MEEQDAIHEQYKRDGIVKNPYKTTDEDIRWRMDSIKNSGLGRDERIYLFETLYFYTINSHEHGMAADVVEEVLQAKNDAIEEIPYKERETISHSFK